jgi:thiosulfate dehydrogenase [quinone] large subunit
MKKIDYSNSQAVLLVTLRVLIGWHFLYEGIVKITNPNWSSVGYLMDSKGMFAEMFMNMANNSGTLNLVNFLNEWGLVLVGLGLILGVLTQVATIGGIVMLVFYYLSHPPMPLLSYDMPMEGSYLIVNKTLIELFALALLFVFPSGSIVGLDRLIFKLGKNK